MYTNRSLITHREAFIAALGHNAPDPEQLERNGYHGAHNFNKALERAVWRAITLKQIAGRLVLRYMQGADMLMHGTPRTYEEIEGVLRPSIPCRHDLQGRAYPMGKAAVCASKHDIEQPIRKALLHHDRPELQHASPVLWRRKDALGRPWQFTSRQALDRLRDANSTGTVLFWPDKHRLPPFFDEARNELYPYERWHPEEVIIPENRWTTITIEDLPLDYASRVPSPTEDLYVIDATTADAIAYLQLLPQTDNFVQLSDAMSISVTPISGYYPSELAGFS